MTAVWHHGFVGRTYWNTHEGLFMVAIPYENLVLIDVEVLKSTPSTGCSAWQTITVGWEALC